MNSTGFPILDLPRFGPDQTVIPTEAEAAEYCRSLTQKHYENFSVATFLLPRDMREHFYAVYAYCRWADDLGDESADALHLLDWWETLLDGFYADSTTAIHPVFIALNKTIREFGIPKQPFADLLVAFRQDQVVKEYETRDDLLHYCRHSANPVGRIILHLARTTDAESLRLSDAVCTGLQLANFWQDVARDWDEKGRIYLPREDRLRFGVTDTMFRERRATPEFRALLAEETDWAESFFRTGAALPSRLNKTFSRDVRLFSAGGLAILAVIRRQNYDVWTRRPSLSKWQKFCLLLRCLAGFLPFGRV